MVYQEYLVSLPKDKDRRASFYEQSYGKNFIHVPAIEGKNEPDKLLSFDGTRAYNRYGRTLTPGEKACTLSHIEVYRQFLQNSEAQYAIICEDDALFSSDYPLIYEILGNPTFAASFLVIGESKSLTYKGNLKYRLAFPMQSAPACYTYEDRDYVVGKLWREFTCGTVAYVISREAANAIVTYVDRYGAYWLADDFEILEQLVRYDVQGNVFYVKHMYPRLVIEDVKHVSGLDSERKLLQLKGKGKGSNLATKSLSQKIKLFLSSLVFYELKKKGVEKEVRDLEGPSRNVAIDPYFSIVIPVYNGESTVKQAIASCLEQSFSNIEVVVVDDGSTDNTVNVIKSIGDPRIRLIELVDNRGTYEARRKGIEEASAPYVLFLDSDDILVPHCCSLLSRCPDCDLLIFQYIQSDTYAINPPMEHFAYGSDSVIEDIGKECIPFDWSIAGKLYNRQLLLSALADIGRPEERMINAEDLLLYAVCLTKVKKAFMIREPLYTYHREGSVRSYQTVGSYGPVIAAYQKYCRTVDSLYRGTETGKFLTFVGQRIEFEQWYAGQSGVVSPWSYFMRCISVYGPSYVLRKFRSRLYAYARQ